MAWVCKNGLWESTPITSSNESDLDDADIVAKLYEVKTNGITNKITPKSFLWQGETISFKEGTEYHMVIEGSGEMPALMTTDGDNITGSYGWQAPSAMYIMKYLTTHTMPDDTVFTPYITELIVCEGITKIGDYAFDGGTGLKSFQIAHTVKEIGIFSFMLCNGLDKVIIPSTVETVNIGAFSSCNFLKKVTIKDGVKSLKDSIFYNCISLTNISIPESITSLESNTFQNCTNLTNISIPSSVTSIKSNAFGHCISLSKVKILSKNLENISNGAFYFVYNNSNIKFYVLNAETKQVLINNCEIPESKIEVVTDSEMNNI